MVYIKIVFILKFEAGDFIFNKKTTIKKTRIWELDFFRGVCILFVIYVHFTFDIAIFMNKNIELSVIFVILSEYGGILFVILSGICVTLGSHSTKRGLIVFSAGILISVVSFFFDRDLFISFGVLHLLGVCMIIYPLFKKMPIYIISIFSAIIIILGFYFYTFYIKSPYFFYLGLITNSYSSADYFPLFPNLGYFLVGIVLGRTLYKNKTTLFKKVPADILPIRFLTACGRNSLWIYLAHQPLIYLIMMVISH